MKGGKRRPTPPPPPLEFSCPRSAHPAPLVLSRPSPPAHTPHARPPPPPPRTRACGTPGTPRCLLPRNTGTAAPALSPVRPPLLQPQTQTWTPTARKPPSPPRPCAPGALSFTVSGGGREGEGCSGPRQATFRRGASMAGARILVGPVASARGPGTCPPLSEARPGLGPVRSRGGLAWRRGVAWACVSPPPPPPPLPAPPPPGRPRGCPSLPFSGRSARRAPRHPSAPAAPAPTRPPMSGWDQAMRACPGRVKRGWPAGAPLCATPRATPPATFFCSPREKPRGISSMYPGAPPPAGPVPARPAAHPAGLVAWLAWAWWGWRRHLPPPLAPACAPPDLLPPPQAFVAHP